MKVVAKPNVREELDKQINALRLENREPDYIMLTQDEFDQLVRVAQLGRMGSSRTISIGGNPSAPIGFTPRATYEGIPVIVVPASMAV